MTRAKQPRTPAYNDLSRRELLGATASTGALLALSPQMLPAQASDRGARRQTFFLNLSHEDYVGHDYYLHIAGQRHRLREIGGASAASLRLLQSNSFLAALPTGQITHVLEEAMLPSNQVLLTYTSKDPNYSTGQWEMPCMFLIPPAAGLLYAYQRARALVGDQIDLPLSAKRTHYGIRPARSYTDSLEEHMLLDNHDWAAALVNVHPEILSADGDSAAHVQTNYIQTDQNLGRLAMVLSEKGPAQPQAGSSDNAMGWATLVPYTDENGTPIVSKKGNNKNLIQYDARWQPALKSYIVKVLTDVGKNVKNDVTLGVNISASDAAANSRGTLWTRTDGVAAIDQTSEPAQSSNVKFTLTNVTPSFNGYSCALTSSDTTVTLTATNWYLRYLGLYVQFLKDDGNNPPTVVPVSELPAGIVPNDLFVTENNEFLVSQINPEFTIYGIPVQSSSSAPFTFSFPSSVATSAKVIASGLGGGSHTAQDTETLGIILTSLFNLIVPAALLFVGAGTFVDAIVKVLGIPLGLTLVQFLEAAVVESGPSVIATLLWRAVAKGGTSAAAKAIAAIADYIAVSGAAEAAEDAIPIAGVIVQVIGLIGTTAELATTAFEVNASPWSYVYTLAGTYDLTLSIQPDPNGDGSFPASAVRYTTTAIFNNGTPHTVTNSVAGGQRGTVTATLSSVPIGGEVVLSVGFYTADGSLVGYATTKPLDNVPDIQAGSDQSVVLTELPVAITAASVYQHKQHTVVDLNGHHQWVCAPAPPFPSVTENCSDQPGSICQYRNITISTKTGDIGYGWNGFAQQGCNGGTGLLDQMANIRLAPSGSDVQSAYAALPCALSGAAQLVYDPLSRSDVNFYLDASGPQGLLRSVYLDPPNFTDPHSQVAWGAFSLASSDLLLHPGGVVLSINQNFGRLEALQLPKGPLSDKQAATDLIATLHGGVGTRPGLFSQPILATVTSNGVVLVLEKGNNRIHAVDASGNPIRHFTAQREPYFLVLTETGSEATHLDIAAEYSGLIYVLSLSAGTYRLDIYDPKGATSTPISTTRNFNAAKIAVDYWRNVYSLNFSILGGTGSPANPTEPQISQWIAATPPACASAQQPARTRHESARLLRRRDLLAFRPTQA